jgi:hypothetical protein
MLRFTFVDEQPVDFLRRKAEQVIQGWHGKRVEYCDEPMPIALIKRIEGGLPVSLILEQELCGIFESRPVPRGGAFLMKSIIIRACNENESSSVRMVERALREWGDESSNSWIRRSAQPGLKRIMA